MFSHISTGEGNDTEETTSEVQTIQMLPMEHCIFLHNQALVHLDESTQSDAIPFTEPKALEKNI